MAATFYPDCTLCPRLAAFLARRDHIAVMLDSNLHALKGYGHQVPPRRV